MVGGESSLYVSGALRYVTDVLNTASVLCVSLPRARLGMPSPDNPSRTLRVHAAHKISLALNRTSLNPTSGLRLTIPK
jgi:hypothetical protein